MKLVIYLFGGKYGWIGFIVSIKKLRKMNVVMFSLLLKCINLRVIYLYGIFLVFEKIIKVWIFFSVDFFYGICVVFEFD